MKDFDDSELLREYGVLPITCLKNENELKTFEEAILATPIKCFEITMRHPFSYSAIRYFKEKHPEYAVGAGTVVNFDILNTVAEVGADYCVSPGLDESIVIHSSKIGIPFIPGCATPSEILRAQKLNLKTVKLFPVECFGEPQILNLYESAFPSIRFLLTGALNTETFIRYLPCANVLACGGDFLVPRDLLEKRDAKGIANTINSCIQSAKEIRERII